MSLATLKSDQRYQDLNREFLAQARNIDLNNPAFADGRVTSNVERVSDQMLALAVEHGWDVETNRWVD